MSRSIAAGTTIGELVRLTAESLGQTEPHLLRQVANFVKPSGAGDSDPKRETILSYGRTPQTRCGYKFAGMVLDFLFSHRRDVKNADAMARARSICMLILGANQQKRYHHPPRTNPASVHRIAKIAGVYLLIRRATSDQSLRQELLIMASQGDEHDRNMYATYINHELVCRGMWCVVRDTASSIMHGYRGNYGRPDIISFNLLYEEPEGDNHLVFLSGFASGITSSTAEPAVVPVVAISILENPVWKDADVLRIGDAGDAEIRSLWRSVANQKSSVIEKIGDILDSTMKPNNGALIRHPNEVSSEIRRAIGRMEEIIPNEIVAFCRSYTAGYAW